MGDKNAKMDYKLKIIVAKSDVLNAKMVKPFVDLMSNFSLFPR